MLPAFDWNGGRLQLESLAGIVGIRTERLARMEASWVEQRKETIANIKSGLVELQIKTVLMKARAFAKPTNSS